MIRGLDLRADVDPTRWLVEDQDPRLRGPATLARTTFCWLPPDSAPFLVDAGIRNVELLGVLTGDLALECGVRSGNPRETGAKDRQRERSARAIEDPTYPGGPAISPREILDFLDRPRTSPAEYLSAPRLFPRFP